MNNENKFFTFSCISCGDVQLGKMVSPAGQLEFIPIFPTRILAEIALSEFPVSVVHPQHVVEISVKII